MDKELPFDIKKKIYGYLGYSLSEEDLKELKQVSAGWNEAILEDKYGFWFSPETFEEYYNIGHKYVSSIYLHPCNRPCEEFYNLVCPRIATLGLEYDHGLLKSLGKFTKANPTIMGLNIECDITSEEQLPIMEMSAFFDTIRPLYERLTMLNIENIVLLPSLSFLLEKLPSLGCLKINYCILGDVSDIFVLKNHHRLLEANKSHIQPSSTTSTSLMEPFEKKNNQIFYNITDLELRKWFVSKNLISNVMSNDVVFNASLFPNLKCLDLRTHFVTAPTIPVYNTDITIDFGLIPHHKFFNSVTTAYKSLTKISLVCVIPNLIYHIANSDCSSNLESLEITGFHETNTKQDISETFKTISSTKFPKLTNLKIGMWQNRGREIVFPIKHDSAFYSTGPLSEGGFALTALEGDIERILSLCREIQLRDNSPRVIEYIMRFLQPLSFSCVNTLRSLSLSSIAGSMTPDVLFPIAQFTGLEYLKLELSTLNNIELQKPRIEKYYTCHPILNDLNIYNKPFGKLVRFTLDNNGFNPNIDQFIKLIRLFPVLRIFNYHHRFKGHGHFYNKNEFLQALKQKYPDMIIII